MARKAKEINVSVIINDVSLIEELRLIDKLSEMADIACEIADILEKKEGGYYD